MIVAPQMVSTVKQAPRAGRLAALLKPDLPALQARLVILFSLIAAAAATFSYLALCLDGSYYMYKLLDEGHTLAPHGRLGTSIIQLPSLWALQLSGSLYAAILAFCAVYALFPVTSMFLSWLMIRKQAPPMMIWPAIAICMISVFTQPCLIAENLICCQLVWPIFLGTVFPGGWFRAAVIVVLACFLTSFHPVSVPLLLASALAPLALLCFRIKLQRSQVVTVLCLLGIALWKLFSFYTSGNVYEHDALDWKTTRWYIEHGFSGFPLATSMAAITAGLLVVICSIIVSTRYGARVTGPRFTAFTSCTTIYLCLGGGFCANQWSLGTGYWDQILPFGRFLCAPFGIVMFLCLMDAIRELKSKDRPQEPFRKTRFAITCLAGFFFLTATLFQGVVWNNLLGRLHWELESSKSSVLCVEKEKWLSNTSLSHWSSTFLAMVIQGQYPEKFLLTEKAIQEAGGHPPFKLCKWEKPTNGIWFKLPREISK